jgi:hypothetical protein
MRWENWNKEDGLYRVAGSVWNGHYDEPQTEASCHTIPVIPLVTKMWGQHAARLGTSSPWMFPNRQGTKPLNFNHVMARHLKPRPSKAGVAWHGWHAYRRAGHQPARSGR